MQVDLFFKGQDAYQYQIIPIASTAFEALKLTLPKALIELLEAQDFSGNLSEIAFGLDNGRTIYIGLGDAQWDEALGAIALKLVPGAYKIQGEPPHSALMAFVLSQYRFDMFKKGGQIRSLCLSESMIEAISPMLHAIFFARDLINQPANILGPEALAEYVSNLANTFDGQYQQWVGEDLLDEGFRAIYAVGKAAQELPRLSVLRWGQPHHPKVTLIGKGVCFDSGGLDIKPSSNMRTMKKDMGGAAIALGLAEWIMETKLPVSLTVLIPAVENAIGSRAYRPGDILTMKNGLTVEIDNTDAEGRLILADALTYASDENPDLLIDFSTLTGAARVAVGTEISAMFSNHDTIAQALISAGEITCDPIWRMPLYKSYNSMLDSKVADLVNSSPSSYAGAITAALFLERFVKPGIPWVHFDLMAWNLNTRPGKPEGGEAMALMAVAHYLKNTYLPMA